jgi:murein lipoprotein
MMKKRLVQLVKFSALVLPLSLAVGCATTADLEKVKAIATDAKQSADQAGQTASEAKSMASQAMQKADESKACCDDVNQKIDRMFHKSMRK